MFQKIIIVTAFVVFSWVAAYSQEIWVGKDGNIRNVDTRAMVASGEGLYLATRDEIYHAGDSKEKWESIFTVPSGGNEVTCLAISYKNIFVGTKRGLFRSQDGGRNWKSVFRTILPDKNNIISIEISKYYPRKIFIGTVKGIFLSDDLGDNWQEISGNLKNVSINCIALNKDSMYAGGEDGLYIRNKEGDGWERAYVTSAVEKLDQEEPSDTAEVEGEVSRSINCIAIKASRIYIGNGKNISYSDNDGKGWNSFVSNGLAGYINYILPSKKADTIYCATSKGVFVFDKDKNKWQELYKGISSALSVKRIVFEGEDEKTLWAVADKGVYKLENGRFIADQYIDVEKNLKSLKIMFDNEPSFKELQQAALKFAELDPDKISKWRNEARLKALVPKVTVGMDKNSSNTYEIYTSATKDYVVNGPDDIKNGVNVSVSWELGNLIWSDDQTNIDVRSRLTTQLRNDVLDDLRRAYYERKRLQFELITEPPKDIKARFEKELRIQELTSAIDDLTGNYLSDHIKSSG